MYSENRLSKIPLMKDKGIRRSNSIHGSSSKTSSGNRRSNSAEPVNRFHPSYQQPAKTSHQDFVKDPRPINDKKFKDILFQKLVKFLANNNYPHKLKLLQISNTEFRRIFEFIVSLILPGYKILNLEADVLKIMHKFGYPFNISKTTMTTIGAPHSWPHLLAILDFLCDYVDIQLSIDEDDDTNVDNKIVSEYMHRCYDTYFSQSSNSLDFPQHDEWLKNALLKKVNSDVLVENLKNKEILESINTAKSLKDKNNEEIESLQLLLVDKQKIIAYNNNYSQYNDEQRSFLRDLKIELDEYERRMQELKDAVPEKEQIFKTQKQSNLLLNDLQHEHQKFTKFVKTKTCELEKYNLEKSKFAQLTSDLHQELLNGLDKIVQCSQMMGFNNSLIPNNLSTIQNESQFSDIIPKLLTIFNKLSKQYEEKFLHFELAVAQASTAFHTVENEKLMLEHNLHVANDEIQNLEILLAENVQMRQNFMVHLNEFHQISNQIKKEEANVKALVEQIDAQKKKNVDQRKDNELCIKECEYFIELTRAEYERQIKSAVEFFHKKGKLVEVMAKF